jgi:ketosteroid isomerase-like protein
MTLEDMVRRVDDRLSIAEVLAAYCRALDTMQLDALEPLFTPDCVVEFGSDERLNARSAAELVEKLARLWRWRRTSHHLSNVEITFGNGTQATVRSYVIAWHERADGGTATLYGVYRDKFVRTPQGWRIAQRRQEMNGSDAGFTVGIFPTVRQPPPAGWIAPQIQTS